MTRLIAALSLTLAVAAAQQKPASPSVEQQDLDRALSEAGTSPVEFLRAIESHLAKYPNSPRRPELERAAVRAAMDANDEDFMTNRLQALSESDKGLYITT